MEARQLRKRGERGLEPHVLRGAELALKHKLRRKFSADFTARHADDLIVKAAKEYAVAVARGERIENPGGFLVDVAYKRAIDALRKRGTIPSSTIWRLHPRCRTRASLIHRRSWSARRSGRRSMRRSPTWRERSGR